MLNPILHALRESIRKATEHPLRDRRELLRLLKAASTNYTDSHGRVSCSANIDSELASQLLRFNWNNRMVIPGHVRKMVIDARQGRFPLMPEPLIFVSYTDDRSTFVWDGQTRLEAANIFGEGLTFNVLVLDIDRHQEKLMRACEAESRKRSLLDITQELHLPDADALSAVQIYVYPQSARRGKDTSVPLLMEDYQRDGERVYAALKTTDELFSNEDGLTLGKRFRVPVAIAMLHAFELDPLSAGEFFEVFCYPHGRGSESHPAKVLRREMLARQSLTDNKKRSPEIRALIYAVFTWFKNQRIRYPDSEVRDFALSILDLTSGCKMPANLMADRPPASANPIEEMQRLFAPELLHAA